MRYLVVLTFLFLFTPGQAFAASGETIVGTLPFTNSGGIVVGKLSFANSGGIAVNPYIFNASDAVQVTPFPFQSRGGVLIGIFGDDALIPLDHSNYVRLSDYSNIRDTIESFSVQVRNIGPFSWTTASSGGVLEVAHLMELVTKMSLIQDTGEVRAIYPQGLFYDESGSATAVPNFTSNTVFQVGVFDNEYRKLLRANNLLRDFLPIKFKNRGGISVYPFVFSSSGGILVNPFVFSSSGGILVNPFVFSP